MFKLNEAQKNLIELLSKIPKEEVKERTFIKECIEKWNGYTDMQYSTPHWQLKALEEQYGLTVPRINRCYK